MDDEELKKEIINYLESDEFEEIANKNELTIEFLITTVATKFKISKNKVNKIRKKYEELGNEFKKPISKQAFEILIGLNANQSDL